MRLYLVIGCNHFPIGNRKSAKICGLFRSIYRAHRCPIPDFDYREVIEIESDFGEEEFFDPKKTSRMLRMRTNEFD